MVEYGGGINQGPAGQVGGGGGGGAPDFGTQTDLFSGLGGAVNDGMSWLGSLPPEGLLAVVAVLFVGLLVIRRVAF